MYKSLISRRLIIYDADMDESPIVAFESEVERQELRSLCLSETKFAVQSCNVNWGKSSHTLWSLKRRRMNHKRTHNTDFSVDTVCFGNVR